MYLQKAKEKWTVELYQILVFLKTIFMVKKALAEEADSLVNTCSVVYFIVILWYLWKYVQSMWRGLVFWMTEQAP